jgi:hypothetical protein
MAAASRPLEIRAISIDQAVGALTIHEKDPYGHDPSGEICLRAFRRKVNCAGNLCIARQIRFPFLHVGADTVPAVKELIDCHLIDNE